MKKKYLEVTCRTKNDTKNLSYIDDLIGNKRYPDGFIFNLHDADVGDTWFMKVIEMEEDKFNGMEEFDYE